jgi:hypothetical protein
MAAGALACVLVGAMIGGSGPTPVSDIEPATTADPPDHSKAAVVSAAGAWLDAVANRRNLLDENARSEMVERLVAEAARARLGDELEQAADALASTQSSPAPVVRSTPIGYRITSFSADRAEVSSWEVLSRSSLEIAPSALWARTDLELVWEDGWRIADATSELTDPKDWTAVELAAMDEHYRSFRHVP